MGSGSSSSLEPPGRRRTKKRSKLTSAMRSGEWGVANSEWNTSIRQLTIRYSQVTFGHGPCGPMDTENESNQADRTISTGKLHALPHLHTRPINVVVFHGSQGNARFEVGFPLRCFQRLSRPYIAMQHCRWRDNCSTRGTFTPVLSY